MHIDVEFSVDRESLRRTLNEVERKIKRGSVKGLEDTLQQGQAAARERIMERRNPFTSPHLKDRSSFYTNTIEEDNKIRGVILNTLDYAAYVDEGVSGTKNLRDTRFAYTDSKPPIQKLVPWVQKHLNAWDIENDPDPFETDHSEGSSRDERRDDGSEFYNDLDEYDLPDSFEKKRLTDSDEFARGVDVEFATNSSGDTYFGTVRRTTGDGIGDDEIELRSPVFSNPEIIDPSDSDYDFVGRQRDKSFWELERGDEIVINTFDDRGIEKENRYGEVESVEGEGDQKRIYFDNYFNEDLPIRIEEIQYVGTREENSDLWGDNIDFNDDLQSLPGDLVEPEFRSQSDEKVEEEFYKLFSNFAEFERKDIAVTSPDGKTFIPDISADGKTYTIDGGYDVDGNRLKFVFSTPEQLYDSDWEIVGINKRRKDFLRLEDGDEIIVDVSDVPNPEDYGYSGIAAGRRLIRAKAQFNYKDRPFILPSGVPPSNSYQQRVKMENFEGTRESLSGPWEAKQADIGKKIRYDSVGGIQEGIYVGSPGDDRKKQYQLSSFRVYNEEQGEVNVVQALDVKSVEDIEDYNFDLYDRPSDSEIENNLPDDFTTINLGREDPTPGEDYYAYLKRQDEYIPVEVEKNSVGSTEIIPAADGDNRPLTTFLPEERAFPVEIVGVRSEEDYPDRADTLIETDTPELDYSEVYEGMEVVWKDNNIDEFESGVIESYNSEIVSISRENKPGNRQIEYALTGENSEYEITHANKFDSLSDSEKRDQVKREFDSVPNQSSYDDSFVKGRVKDQIIDDSIRTDLVKPVANSLDLIDDDDPSESRRGVSDGPQDALYVKYNSDGSAPSSTTLHEPTHSFHSAHGYEANIYPDKDFDWDDWNFFPNGAGKGATKNASEYFMRGGFNTIGNPDNEFVGQGNVIERAAKEMGMLNVDYYRDNPRTPSITTQQEDGTYVFDVEEGTNLLFEHDGRRFSGQVRSSTTVEGDKSATVTLYDYRRSRRENLFLDQQTGEIKAGERFVDAGNEVISEVVVEYVDNYGKTPDPRDWEPQSDNELEQLFEAVNRAWWKQVFRNSVKDKPGEAEWRGAFLGSDYSMRSPKETLTRTSEMLFAREDVSSDAPTHFASTLEFRFPNLVEAWTNIWKPSVDVNDNWLDDDHR